MYRRLILLSIVLLLAAALLPAVARAIGVPVAQSGHKRQAAGAMVARAQAMLELGKGPRRIITDGPLALSGTVSAYDGTPISGAEVDWGYYTYDENADDGPPWWPRSYTAYTFGNWTTTGADGTYAISGVNEQTDGAVEAYFDDASGLPTAYLTWNNPFTSPGPVTRDLRPGGVPVTTDDEGGAWGGWTNARVGVFTSAGYARSWIGQGGGRALAMPSVSGPAAQVGEVDLYYWDNQGTTIGSFTGLVTAGADTESIGFSQTVARRAFPIKPYWFSGKPGSTVTIGLEHWQSYDLAKYWGYSEYPFGSSETLYTKSTDITDFYKVHPVSLTIPKTATPGYDYQVHVYPRTTMLDLRVYFQVCTLKASSTSIRKGGSTTLSGVIPTQGHWGSTPGKTKSVTIYKRSTLAGVPTTWDATKKGWTVAATVKASGLGKYAKKLAPTKSTWYVVRYPGDDWYYRGYTSVIKVTVR